MEKAKKSSVTNVIFSMAGIFIIWWLYNNLPFVLYPLWLITILVLFSAFSFNKFSFVTNQSKAIFGFTIIMSLILIFYDLGTFRDFIGNNYIEGYSVSYYESCCADDGSPYIATDIDTSTLLGRIIIWAIDFSSFIILLFINIFVFYIYLNTKKEPSLVNYSNEK